jgi:MtN3 and saliva related transmembrane protein
VDSIQLVGYAAAVCTTVSHIPQLMRVWRTRSTEDISLRMFLILAAGLALWTAFGVLTGSMPIIVANAVSFVFASTILGFKLRYG